MAKKNSKNKKRGGGSNSNSSSKKTASSSSNSKETKSTTPPFEKALSGSSQTKLGSSWQALGTVIVVAIAIFVKDFYLPQRLRGTNGSDAGHVEGSGDPMNACTAVMSNSSFPDGGWGMFLLKDIPRGTPVSDGDVVIPVPEVTGVQYAAIKHFLHAYMWHSDVGGGLNEGHVVHSVISGVGSLLNGNPVYYNVAPQPGSAVDNAGVSRVYSPGAGAFTHYHGMKYFSVKHLMPGDELLLDYGKSWAAKLPETTHIDPSYIQSKPVESLKEHGVCTDHIYPGMSTLAHAGRGALASRFLPKGTVVAPAPLIPIFGRIGLDLGKDRPQQLLLNYCFGHPNSSLLLFPYAPVVNLINHHPQHANVEVRWSNSSLHYSKHLLNKPIDAIQESPFGLLMEFVATHDIQEGEEVLLNYGEAWHEAFQQHVMDWKPTVDETFQYADELNRELTELRTEEELLYKPYPGHVRTTCFYEFDPNRVATGGPVRWETSQRISQLSNQYPCRIHKRDFDEYTVEILNREDIASQQQRPIPPGHTVKNVPRRAIRITEKMHTSDQHLRNAFRHEIGVPDGVFPTAWMDL